MNDIDFIDREQLIEINGELRRNLSEMHAELLRFHKRFLDAWWIGYLIGIASGLVLGALFAFALCFV